MDGRLDNVLYVPEFKKNLFSINACTEKGIRAIYEDDRVILQMKNTNEVVAEGVKYHSDMCCLFFKVERPEANYDEAKLQSIHESLGHVNKTTLRKMIHHKAVDGVQEVDNSDFFCEGCVFGKMHRLPCKSGGQDGYVYSPGECIHADLCGPTSVSLGNARYFMLLKDRCTGYRWVYFLKRKSDSLQFFKVFCNEVETTTGYRVKILRTDGGLEFCNADFKSFLGSRGIRLCTSAPYRPQQNGRIERENRTVIESARSMLHARNCPQFLWAEAVNTAVYALNKTVPSNSENFKSPYEMWYKRKPNVSHMRPFGVKAYVYIPNHFRAKFDKTASEAILVGYDGDSGNYRLYDSKKNKVTISKDVKFKDDDGDDISIKVGGSVNSQIDATKKIASSLNGAMDISIDNEVDTNSAEPMDVSEHEVEGGSDPVAYNDIQPVDEEEST